MKHVLPHHSAQPNPQPAGLHRKTYSQLRGTGKGWRCQWERAELAGTHSSYAEKGSQIVHQVSLQPGGRWQHWFQPALSHITQNKPNHPGATWPSPRFAKGKQRLDLLQDLSSLPSTQSSHPSQRMLLSMQRPVLQVNLPGQAERGKGTKITNDPSTCPVYIPSTEIAMPAYSRTQLEDQEVAGKQGMLLSPWKRLLPSLQGTVSTEELWISGKSLSPPQLQGFNSRSLES